MQIRYIVDEHSLFKRSFGFRNPPFQGGSSAARGGFWDDALSSLRWTLHQGTVSLRNVVKSGLKNRTTFSSREHESLIAFWMTLPVSLRFFLLGILGVLLGAFANHAIYRFAWFPRPISPWGKPDENAPPRTAVDRIPILGWFGLRREFEIHGTAFWIRPLAIEIALGAGIPAYYYWLTQTGSVLPMALRNPGVIAANEAWMTAIFVSHLLMITLMVAATFIDFDEQTIPDLLTVPGTLLALIAGAVTTSVFLPGIDAAGLLRPMTFELPAAGPGAIWFERTGLWTALGIWTGWCFALSNRRVILRHGLVKALEYFLASLVRYPTWRLLLAMWLFGGVAIRVVFSIGGLHWLGLFTALVGLAVGGGVVWVIRIVGSLAMRREALGFGDVTLMAMIGAFVGWQGAVMSFFLAPIAAIGIVLVYFLITRNSEVPFGPYLCAGTMLTIFGWDRLVTGWFLNNLAILGPFMLWLFVALTGIMGGLLLVWRIVKETYLEN